MKVYIIYNKFLLIFIYSYTFLFNYGLILCLIPEVVIKLHPELACTLIT